MPVEVLNTEGAVENRELLGIGHAEVALMQAGTISSDDLAVVAPVYEEYIHFVVRADRNIETVKELSNRNVVVTVCDDGPGIPRHLREQVMKPFERGSSSGQDGYGLGLAVAVRIAKYYGGYIHIDDCDRLGGALIGVYLEC